MKKRFTKFYIIGIHSSGNKEEFKFFVDLHTLYVQSLYLLYMECLSVNNSHLKCMNRKIYIV